VSNIETSDLETHLLECYLFVDDYLKSNPKVADWRRSNNSDPEFTDAEVIVIALMQGYFRTDTLKRTYELVVANAEKAFPSRAGYKQWIRRLQRLPDQVGRLARAAALRGLAGEGRKLYAADSLPIPLCESARHGRARLLDEDGAKFGVDASGDWFYGFKMHAPHSSADPGCNHCNAFARKQKRSDRCPRIGPVDERRCPFGGRGLSRRSALRLALQSGANASGDAIGRFGRGPFSRQPGPAAGRKQFFRPLAPILEPGVRSVLAWSLDEPVAEGAALQPRSSRYCLSTG